MGRGDRYQQASLTVPMPPGVTTWPFERRAPRAYCPLCDRPLDYCDCRPIRREERSAYMMTPEELRATGEYGDEAIARIAKAHSVSQRRRLVVQTRTPVRKEKV